MICGGPESTVTVVELLIAPTVAVTMLDPSLAPLNFPVALTWILHAFEGVAACEIAKVPVLQG